MVVTALLMGVALKGNRPLSDAEIRQRAMELGMVSEDSRTLTDIQNAQEAGALSPDGPDSGDTPGSAPSPAPEESADPPAPSPTVEPEPTGTPEPTATPDPLKPLPMVTLKPSQAESDGQDSVSFVVERGQSSYSVSKALEDAGLVEDASEFDQYLEENGYSKRISVGTYEIPVDASQEEIAKIITRSR